MDAIDADVVNDETLESYARSNVDSDDSDFECEFVPMPSPLAVHRFKGLPMAPNTSSVIWPDDADLSDIEPRSPMSLNYFSGSWDDVVDQAAVVDKALAGSEQR